jgi:cbb3-type cytochrome oxidase subunit 3
MDSHGLLWQASPSGVSVYDRKAGQMQLLDMKSGFYGSNVVALAEDDRHSMWVVTDHGISNVTPQKEEDGHWVFAVRSYNDRDGLQPGPFNQRAICYTRTGYLLVGGQDGLDIINTRNLDDSGNDEKPVFSGLVLFNDEVEVGAKYNGRILLKKALDLERSITLKSSENQFTIQMASNNGGAKNHTRFVYRLKGFNDKWIKTTSSNSDITYMGLPAGSYTLCVRMLKDDGTMGDTESQLDITIEGPWYTSWWAFLIYVLILGLAIWYWLQRKQKKQQFTPQQVEEKEEVPEEEDIPEEGDDVEEAIILDDEE